MTTTYAEWIYLQSQNYRQLWQEKAQKTIEFFNKQLENPPLDHTAPSASLYHRNRAEFRLWHDQEGCHHLFYRQNPEKITSFPIATLGINLAIRYVQEILANYPLIARGLYQVQYLANSDDSDIIITLIYKTPLTEKWLKQIEPFNTQTFSFIGRSKGITLTSKKSIVTDSLTIDNQLYLLQKSENTFSQPNHQINLAMHRWLHQHISPTPQEDYLELYCGQGNFTIPMAHKFRHCLATEIVRESIALAQENCSLNQIESINFVRLSSQETDRALSLERPFRRLKNIDLNQYSWHTLLIDPPRSGLDQDSLKIAQQFNRIIYVSCNPQTMVRDIQNLPQFQIKRYALFDQFPYTDHIETIAILETI